MPKKSQKDVSSIKESSSEESILFADPLYVKPGQRDVEPGSKEIPRAELIMDSEEETSVDEAGDVPLFKTENVGTDALSPLIASEAGGKIAPPNPVLPSTHHRALDTLRQPGTWPDAEFSSVGTLRPDVGFPEFQPPLAILAISFLVLMFLLW